MKRFLQLQNPEDEYADDEELGRLVTACTAAIGRAAFLPARQDGGEATFFADTYTERYDGKGTDALLLRWRPVLEVTAVAIDGVAVPAGSDGAMAGFVFDTSAVYYRGGRFPKGRQNVLVTHRGGFADGGPEAEDLRNGCAEFAAELYRKKPYLGIQSKTLGPETITFAQRAMPPAVKLLCEQLAARVHV